MKIKPRFSLLLMAIVWSLSFQSCDKFSKSTTEGNTDETTQTTEKSISEMTIEEQSNYAAKHAESFTFIEEKSQEIINEHISKKDHFTFECENGRVELERIHNDKDEIHFLSYTLCQGEDCSTKQHKFWDNKLIYQMHHHYKTEGDKIMVDDHRTYFKDGKMIQCLEKQYSYGKHESIPHDIPYKQVDCIPADKLTKDIEKLLTLSEEEAKAYLCGK